MIVHDFQCPAGHVSEHYVSSGTKSVSCPICRNPARVVFLHAPRLDWAGMAQGENAGPEFVDRFERIHKKEQARHAKYREAHGDNMPGFNE